jgi:purine-nucleoside phosphorylase
MDHPEQALYDQVQAAANVIREQTGAQSPACGIVLGSGLGALVQRLQQVQSINYADIPHFPQSTVVGHAGTLHLGVLPAPERPAGGDRAAPTPCVVLSGRAHFYEGHSLQRSTFGIRVLAALGVRRLVLTNAAGGVNPHFDPGDFMVLCDHLNLTGDNPLRGPNDLRFGPRFADMTQVYTRFARALWHTAARQVGVSLREGVYAGLSGPSYETPAEVRMLQRLGADAVGMSTVGEALVARHMGLQVAALSVITNRAAGLSATPLSHQEVTDIADRVTPRLCDLVQCMLGLWQTGAAANA